MCLNLRANVVDQDEKISLENNFFCFALAGLVGSIRDK